jgi:hypothetical protein
MQITNSTLTTQKMENPKRVRVSQDDSHSCLTSVTVDIETEQPESNVPCARRTPGTGTPSKELIQLWKDVQEEINRLFGFYDELEADDGPNYRVLKDSLLKLIATFHNRASTDFTKGMPERLYVLSRLFNVTTTSATLSGQVNDVVSVFRDISARLVTAYGLDPLDLPCDFPQLS